MNGHGLVPIKLCLQKQLIGQVQPTGHEDSCLRTSLMNEPAFATTTTRKVNVLLFFSKKIHTPQSPLVDRLID